MLLEAQILFRLGKMDACIDVYQKLRKSKLDSLEINLAASLILAGRSSEVQGMLEAQRIKPSSSYDLAFNAACSLVETNKKQNSCCSKQEGDALLTMGFSFFLDT